MYVSSLSQLVKQHENENKIYLSQELYDEAIEKGKNKNQIAVINHDEVHMIDNELFAQIHEKFPKSFKHHENFFIAKNEASEYLDKIEFAVMHQFNFEGADVNKDGVLSHAEYLDTNSEINILTGDIKTPRQTLPFDVVMMAENDHTPFTTKDEIMNLHIVMDKNKDGFVTTQEQFEEFEEERNSILDAMLGGSGGNSQLQEKLDKLNEQKRKIEKEIIRLTQQMQKTKDEDHKLLLQNQLIGTQARLTGVVGQIMTVLQQQMSG
jgi:hypothetical protein